MNVSALVWTNESVPKAGALVAINSKSKPWRPWPPAARVAASVRAAYATKAAQAKVPFSIDVDPVGNALVVASTGPFFDEVSATIGEMDRLAPAAGQGIFLIDLENVPASVAERAVKRIGLDKAQPADSTSRLVVEPIRRTRNSSWKSR